MKRPMLQVGATLVWGASIAHAWSLQSFGPLRSMSLSGAQLTARAKATALLNTRRARRTDASANYTNYTNYTLTNASEDLQGISDTVTGSFSQVRTALLDIQDECRKQVAASALRVQGHAATNSQLEATRILNIAKVAKLAAEMESIKRAEDSAMLSYQSTVAQRASERKSYVGWNTTYAEQSVVVADVVRVLKEKRDLLAAAGNLSFLEVPQGSIAPGASALDYIIGIFTSMQDTMASEQTQQSAAHVTQDEGLQTLVESQKSSVHHLGLQYATKAAEKADAEAIVTNTREEETFRADLISGEGEVGSVLATLCGTSSGDGTSGSVHVAMTSGDKLLADVTAKIRAVIQSMDTMPLVMTSDAEQFLQLSTRSAQPLLLSKHPAGWDISAQSRNEMVSLAKEAARRLRTPRPRTTIAERLLGSAAIVPASRQIARLHAVRSADFGSGGRGSGVNETQEEIQRCSDEKAQLMSELVAYRFQLEAAQSSLTSAQANKSALQGLETLVVDGKTEMENAKAHIGVSWQQLESLISQNAFSVSLATALNTMSAVEDEVSTYINAGGPPEASGLPVGLAGIKADLQKLQAGVQGDINQLSSTYSTIVVKYAAVVSGLENKDTALGTREASLDSAISSAQTTIQAVTSAVGSTNSTLTSTHTRCEQYFQASLAALRVGVAHHHLTLAALDVAQQLLTKAGLQG